MTLSQASLPKKKILNEKISAIKDKLISNYYDDILRYLVDIEEELVIMSFYNQMIKETQ
ncbi:MAG TPA: hypothetical protein VI564_03330 [Candidatus Nanoarchaeia archaeon]|nr:hypothetical protein [Candidatus Nanoarchaeia archaeon]